MPKKRQSKAPKIARAEEERLIAEAAHRMRKIPPAAEIAEIFSHQSAKALATKESPPELLKIFTEDEIRFRVKKVIG